MQICLKTLREEDFQVARTNKYLYTTKKIKNMRVKSRRRKNMTFATTPLSLTLNPTPLMLYSTYSSWRSRHYPLELLLE